MIIIAICIVFLAHACNTRTAVVAATSNMFPQTTDHSVSIPQSLPISLCAQTSLSVSEKTIWYIDVLLAISVWRILTPSY